MTIFQSTLPARGATTVRAIVEKAKRISIHAPRTGSDSTQESPKTGLAHFNPRSPHGERRYQFQTLDTSCKVYFNPRSPHGERLYIPPLLLVSHQFQSTLPARGATPCLDDSNVGVVISIHAPRTGSDRAARDFREGLEDFNPRSPHGERPNTPDLYVSLEGISIHAPRTGSDTAPFCGHHSRIPDFNPRSPHGERLRKVTILSIRIIDFAQKVYHKTVLLRISLAENAVILPEKPRNPVRTSLQKAGGLRFARAIRAAHPYSISSPSGA